MRGGLLALTVVAAGLLAGCGDAADGPKPARGGPIDLTEVSIAGLEQAVAEQKGKVVLVDVWFLGCPPCVERFPHLVELHHKYAPDGLACMTVDVSDKELKKQDKVLDFLQKQGAEFPNFILTDGDRAVRAWLRKHGVEVTPGVLLYDRSGRQVPVPEDTPMSEVEAMVRQLLARK